MTTPSVGLKACSAGSTRSLSRSGLRAAEGQPVIHPMLGIQIRRHVPDSRWIGYGQERAGKLCWRSTGYQAQRSVVRIHGSAMLLGWLSASPRRA
jgi:hypothetical protein